MKESIKLNIKETYLFKGNYEGTDYYQLVAVAEDDLVLKKKLTAFEYKMLKEMYN